MPIFLSDVDCVDYQKKKPILTPSSQGIFVWSVWAFACSTASGAAPWQNGRVERSIGTLKRLWKTGMTPAKNLIFFGGRLIEHEAVDSLTGKITDMTASRRLPMKTVALLSTRRTKPWPPGVVLSDDFAPYDLLLGRERSQLVK